MSTRTRAPVIRLQRAYDEPGARDGYRVLVDRFWPRGRSKDTLKLDAWARELAPDADLIHWFGHKAERWQEFRHRYRAHLDTPELAERLSALLRDAGKGPITLLYGARSETQNQAVVIAEALSDLTRKRH